MTCQIDAPKDGHDLSDHVLNNGKGFPGGGLHPSHLRTDRLKLIARGQGRRRQFRQPERIKLPGRGYHLLGGLRKHASLCNYASKGGPISLKTYLLGPQGFGQRLPLHEVGTPSALRQCIQLTEYAIRTTITLEGGQRGAGTIKGSTDRPTDFFAHSCGSGYDTVKNCAEGFPPALDDAYKTINGAGQNFAVNQPSPVDGGQPAPNPASNSSDEA